MKVCSACGREWPDEVKFCQHDGTALRSTDGSEGLIGSVLAGRFHILEKLGEGGMGAVYLGEHVKMQRKCAIKVMAPSVANDPDAIARFNREASNASQINHPNVCAIYDFGETPEGLIYLAMELVDGEPLRELLHREGPFAPLRAGSIAKQVGEALEAAHDLGIVHRDLKPDNIMLAKARDGSDVVKVVDFGIAKAFGSGDEQKVTRTGLVVGTPEYMSPEQLSGDRVDGRSDIYALTLVVFQMLTGELPFQADSAQEIMMMRLTDDPLSLNDVVPHIGFPQRLQEVLDWGFQRMPADRCGSAAHFGAEISLAVSRMRDSGTLVLDTQEATEVMDAPPVRNQATTELPDTRISGQEIPSETRAVGQPPPAPKKSLFVALAASIALVVGGGGAVAVVLSRGDSADEPQLLAGQAGVTNDTAAGRGTDQPSPIQSPAVDGEPGGSTDEFTPPSGTSPGEANRRPASAESGRAGSAELVRQPGPDVAATRVALSDAPDVLFRQFDALGDTERAPATILESARDTAQAIWDLQGLATEDSAFAAHVIGEAMIGLGDTTGGIIWLRRAVELDRDNLGYQTALDNYVGRRP